MNIDKKLKQTAVHWAKTTATPGGAGNVGYQDGVDIKVRSEGHSKLVRLSSGDFAQSEARYYYNTRNVTINDNDRLWFGDVASLSAEQISDPALVRGTKEVFDVDTTPNLRNSQTLGKAEMRFNASR